MQTAQQIAALEAVKAAYPWTRRAGLSLTFSKVVKGEDGNDRLHIDAANRCWRIKFSGSTSTILNLMEW